MECGNQGCSLSAGCNITASKIGHDVDVGELRQQRRVVDLQRVTVTVKLLRPVPHRLPVSTDGGHLAR